MSYVEPEIEVCIACHGCTDCNGRGIAQYIYRGNRKIPVVCTTCAGTGQSFTYTKIDEKVCDFCGAEYYIPIY